jgi:FlaA1/EpsC-like NDP-sugar epimerase
MKNFASKNKSDLLIDILIWILSIGLSAVIRFDGEVPQTLLLEIIKLIGVVLILWIFLSFSISHYSNRYIRGSIDEIAMLTVLAFFTTVIIFLIRILFDYPSLPRSISLVSGFISILFMFAIRVLVGTDFLRMYSRNIKGAKTLIYGAGSTGKHIVEQMIKDGTLYNPIGFLDDDLSKSRMRILGRSVLGTLDDFEKIHKIYKPEVFVIAISNIDSALILNIEERCQTLGLNLRIIPSVFEIVTGSFDLSDIHEVKEEDLLGRVALETDETDIQKFFADKRVLITGAGGSIGSEISRQISRYGATELLMLDRDETSLLSLEISLKQSLNLKNKEFILADIRDSVRIKEIFHAYKPHFVFHAAALKHLNFLEKYPEEANKTNVEGTRNVLISAKEVDVEVFINISTDKAANPTSVLGRTKLITEQLTAGVNQGGRSNNKYLSVRFGNVIGSNGSFITIFRHQIKNGGPVTVTHPEVKRYFMTIGEAVHLVLKSSVIGENGDTLILEMGDPVKIDLIAKRMISASGKDIKVVYKGLQPGEKLHEDLFNSEEKIEKSSNNLIWKTRVQPIELGAV